MALNNVSFEVPEGQFLGIIGANGSGKSTLLKILSRIYRPTAGEIRLGGRVSPFLELGVGFNPELTARENVYVNGAILGLSRVDLARRMENILAFAELEDFADQKLKNYSSGMQVRLAFTVAIQSQAPILLMDEVLAVGDARFQAKCFEVFGQNRREGKTVVLVTHDIGAVDTHCDRALLLEHGELVADGLASDVTGLYRRRVGEQQDRDASANGVEPDPERWGTGAVRFRSARLLNSGGEEHTNFISDEEVTLALDLEARDDLDDLVVGFGLHRTDGNIIAGTNTLIERVEMPKLQAGDCIEVRYRIKNLPLLTGSYRLSLTAHPAVHTVTYDHLEQQVKFTATDTRTRVGLFEMGGAWSVKYNAKASLPSRASDR